MHNMKKQRIFSIALLITILTGCATTEQQTKNADKRYKIAVVDLMILKRQKLGAFQLTKDIGADGVEVDMGGLGQRETFDNKLAIDSVREQFLDTARKLNLQICSL